MPRPKHHFVPQMYLKSFKNDESSNGVYRYSRVEGLIEQKNISNTAMQRGFYDAVDTKGINIGDEIEGGFSKMEADTADILKRIITFESVNLSEKERRIMDIFIATLFMRGKFQRDKLVKHSTGMREALEHFFPGISETNPDALKPFGPIPKDELVLMPLRIAIESLAPALAAKSYRLLISETEQFVTSDNPVVVDGLGIQQGVISLPLSPRLCLVLHNDLCVHYEKYHVNLTDVSRLNKLRAIFADDYLYASVKMNNISQMFATTTKGVGQQLEMQYMGETFRY